MTISKVIYFGTAAVLFLLGVYGIQTTAIVVGVG